jgi:hypothetical protein
MRKSKIHGSIYFVNRNTRFERHQSPFPIFSSLAAVAFEDFQEDLNGT